MKHIKGEFILLLSSVLWGSCFVFQKMGMEYIGPYTLGAFRFILGAIILIPVIVLLTNLERKKRNGKTAHNGGFLDKNLYKGGFLCGIALFVAASLQQIGLQYTTSGKAGFITSLEIVLVAGIMIIINKKIQISTIFGVCLAIFGMFLLCISDGFQLGIGDSYVLTGVVFWSLQILSIDYYSKKVDVIKLSFIQFITTGILSLLFMLIFETPKWYEIKAGMIPILYTAIIEVAVAYTLQIIGQKYTPPVIAAVILSLEAVFSVLFGALLLNEVLTVKEVVGCVAMLMAILIVQIPHLYHVQHSSKVGSIPKKES